MATDPRALKQQAQAALDKGKHKKALELYLALERVEPTDGQWARRASDMYRRLGKRQETIDALERAATKYMRAGFLVKSIAVCKMILQIDPGHSAVRERLEALNAERGMTGQTAPNVAAAAVSAPARVSEPVRVSPGRVPAPVRVPEPVPVPDSSARVPAPVHQRTRIGMPTLSLPDAPELDALPPEALPPEALPPELELELEPELELELEPEPELELEPEPELELEPASEEESLDLTTLAALAVQVAESDGVPARAASPPVPRPPVLPLGRSPESAMPPPIPVRRSASGRLLPPLPVPAKHLADRDAGRDGVKTMRARTIPPDAPLDVIELNLLIPGSVDLDFEGMSEGVIEIPLDESDLEPPEPVLDPVHKTALERTPLFSSLGPDAMRRLISEIQLVVLEPGQVLFREGDEGDTLYVIADGAVSVISERPQRTRLSMLQEGDFFGEVAIVTNQPRTATIEADLERGASLLAMNRNVIGDLVDEEPGVLQSLLRFLRDRLVNRLIQTSPLFAPFTGPDSHNLAAKFRFLEVVPGARVLEQDVRASGLCVLLAGQLEALREDGGAVRRVGTLGPGGVCGEMSLLANQPSLFTVQAVSKSFMLHLPAQVFREVIMTHPQVLVFVSDLADEREQRYKAVLAGDADYETGRISLI